MKYKLAGEDEHTFQIQHPDGSTFSIAKHAVGPGVHKKIKELEPVKMSEGGEATEIEDGSSDERSFAPDQSEEAKSVRSFFGIDDVPAPPPSTTADEYIQQASLPVEQPAPIAEQPALDRSPGAAAQPIVPPSAPAVPPVSPNVADATSPAMPATMSDAYAKSFAQKEAGITGVANAQAQAGKEQAAAYQAQADQIAKSQAHYEQAHAQLDAEHKQLTEAVMNEKIDPNRLFHNMGTGNKILAAISVALSGIGSGLSGQPNMAMSVIQKSIDRDIEAQKMELGKKHTLLSENLRRFGDLNTATQMTQLQMNAMTQAKVNQIAARSGSAQSQAQAKMMLGDLGMQAAQIKQQMAMRDAAAKGGGDPSALVRFVVPEPHQKAVFDEIQRAQDTRRMGDTILKSFDAAAKDNTALKTGAGLLRTPATVLALHQSMQPTFKDLEGTVRQAAMDNTFKNITPMPGDMESTIKVKRAALEDYLKSKAAAPTAKGFGIDLDKFSTTTTRGAPETKTVNGVKYMRGPNGEAVPVK